jgi:hypothetical protein
VNLFVLIDQILEDRQIPPLHQITEEEFSDVLEAVWERINLMGRWRDTAAWGEDKKDDEELMWRYGEHRYLLHQLKNGLSLHLCLLQTTSGPQACSWRRRKLPPGAMELLWYPSGKTAWGTTSFSTM